MIGWVMVTLNLRVSVIVDDRAMFIVRITVTVRLPLRSGLVLGLC